MLKNHVQTNSNHNAGSRLPFFMPGAVPVQIERISMETWDNINIPEPIFGTDGTIYHHVEGMEVIPQDFESVVWGIHEFFIT